MSYKRYFFKLSYKGTHFHGWQIQPNGITIQGEITKALRLIMKQPDLTIVGAGRTDTGVHAKVFYAHVDFHSHLDSTEDLKFKLNRFLSSDIAIHDIFEVKPDAHSRFDAQSREYHYFIHQHKEPFSQETSWYLYGNLNVNLMNEAAAKLFSYTDFTSFSKLHTQVKTNNCRIDEARWELQGDNLVFIIKADRFLRNMVRAIVGTLVEVGRGKINIEDFEHIIQNKDRNRAGESAPAQGLFLWDINYDFEKIIIS